MLHSNVMEKNSVTTLDDESFCFNIFHRISRSFSAVTEVLQEPLRTTVRIFYLILRGLDTIEDETTFDGSIKERALQTFTLFLNEMPNRPNLCDYGLRSECNESYIELMENFDKILNFFFSRCTPDAKNIIRDVVDEMASGMIKYSAQSIETLEEYNGYCYYAAGLVGIGLTKLFQLNCTFNAEHARLKHLAISTGTFLQKVNILRDIYEDLSHPAARSFYPKEVWKNYVESARDLIDEKYREQAVACLNHLIDDAFQHLPESIEYLSLVTQTSIFRFVAIPQVIAVYTLEEMFNNPAVFSSSVKIAKTETNYIFENVVDMKSCLSLIKSCLNKLSTRADFLNATCSKNMILASVECACSYNV